MLGYALPQLMAIVGVLVSVAVFFWYAMVISKEKLSLNSFTLADRNVTSNKFGNTFAASSVSLATVIVFFLSTHAFYGYVLIYCALTFIAGQYLFVYVAKKVNIDFTECRTLSDLWFKVFPCKRTARLITIVNILYLTSQFFIEIYIGAVVIKLLLPNIAMMGTFSFLFLGILVLCYVRLGGYKAIICTDRWQLYLMLAAVTAIFLFSFITPITTLVQEEIFVQELFSFEASTGLVIPFVLFITILNFLLPFTDLSSWQRMSASDSLHNAWKGLLRSSWKTIVLWVVPVVGFIIIKAKGYQYNDVQSFFNLLINGGVISQLILYPVIVVGFVSAIFSTADIKIMAIIYALLDQNTFLYKVEQQHNKEQYLRNNLTKFTVLVLIVLAALYYFAESYAQQWLVPFMYMLLSEPLIIFPLYCYAFYHIAKNKNKINVTRYGSSILTIGVAVGWAVMLIAFYVSISSGNHFWTQLAPFISIALMAICLIIAIIYSKFAEPEPMRINNSVVTNNL